jgi:uncharacterized membrane protein
VATDQHTVERWTSQSLKGGVWLSGGVMILGLVWYAARSFSTPLPQQNPTIAQLLHSLINGSFDPFTLMYVGLILLMLTPFLRVLTAVVGFAVEKDRTFVFVSLLVFFFLIGELLYSLYR